MIVQKRKVASKSLPDSKMQEKRDNEEINIINAPNPGAEAWEQEGP